MVASSFSFMDYVVCTYFDHKLVGESSVLTLQLLLSSLVLRIQSVRLGQSNIWMDFLFVCQCVEFEFTRNILSRHLSYYLSIMKVINKNTMVLIFIFHLALFLKYFLFLKNYFLPQYIKNNIYKLILNKKFKF